MLSRIRPATSRGDPVCVSTSHKSLREVRRILGRTPVVIKSQRTLDRSGMRMLHRYAPRPVVSTGPESASRRICLRRVEEAPIAKRVGRSGWKGGTTVAKRVVTVTNRP
jgi:hypothetical protein